MYDHLSVENSLIKNTTTETVIFFVWSGCSTKCIWPFRTILHYNPNTCLILQSKTSQCHIILGIFWTVIFMSHIVLLLSLFLFQDETKNISKLNKFPSRKSRTHWENFFLIAEFSDQTNGIFFQSSIDVCLKPSSARSISFHGIDLFRNKS